MILRRRSDLHPISQKAKDRVSRVAEGDVLAWADVAGAGIARGLSEYGKHRRHEDLDEAYEAVLTMLGCLESLRERVTTQTSR